MTRQDAIHSALKRAQAKGIKSISVLAEFIDDHLSVIDEMSEVGQARIHESAVSLAGRSQSGGLPANPLFQPVVAGSLASPDTRLVLPTADEVDHIGIEGKRYQIDQAALGKMRASSNVVSISAGDEVIPGSSVIAVAKNSGDRIVNHWVVEELREYIELRTPPQLTLVPKGLNNEITLYRKMRVHKASSDERNSGLDSVRISYVLPQAVEGVSEQWAVTTPREQIDVNQAIKNMTEAAFTLYGVKMVSQIPLTGGQYVESQAMVDPSNPNV